jgi:hypothetical protein
MPYIEFRSFISKSKYDNSKISVGQAVVGRLYEFFPELSDTVTVLQSVL